VGTCLIKQRRDVLPFVRNGGSFRVMLIVAPGRALARAGDDRAELPFQFGDLA
jgi:hypothetical protein